MEKIDIEKYRLQLVAIKSIPGVRRATPSVARFLRILNRVKNLGSIWKEENAVAREQLHLLRSV